jgi:hypothetical protein
MPFDNRFDGLDRRVGDFEKELKEIRRVVPPPGFPFASILARHEESAESKTNKFRRNAVFFMPILSLLTLVISFWAGAFNTLMDGRVAARLNEPNGLTAQVHELTKEVSKANGELTAIRTIWQEQVKRASELKPAAFERALPKTADALELALKLDLPISSEVRGAMRRNLLLTDPNAPSYWPAVAQFVTFRSRQNAPPLLVDKGPTLPTCSVVKEGESWGGSAIPQPNGTIKPTITTFSDCAQDIDNRTFKNSTFKHAFIIVSGGQIRLLNVTFEDCVFLVRLPEDPKEPARQFGRRLLVAEKSSIHIDTIG